MEFKDFSEFSDIDEEDFDIKYALQNGANNSNEEDPSNQVEENLLDDLNELEDSVDIPEESYLEEDSLGGLADPEPVPEEDIFEDENIQNTLKRYNYDYRTLVMMLFALSSDDEVMEVLNSCGLNQNDYYHPTAETFELMRDCAINGHKHRL